MKLLYKIIDAIPYFLAFVYPVLLVAGFVAFCLVAL
jgi:hypothetical protein